ncbi:MAG TPA: ABC transporter permease subunit [Candidatus Atribacteria bacterium]|nr:ABC transporter permease subunit [Candidatus Atribacteria bacterium]HPT78293.1 ABC transporter permease subunit [Candidatus Atribacteria bacterium]
METRRNRLSDIMLYLLRAVSILLMISLVLPAFNPARLSALISKDSALLTISLSYTSLKGGFTRAINRGWVEESTITLIFLASVVITLGIAMLSAGCFMTLGKLRFQKLGARLAAIGSAIGMPGLIMLIPAYIAMSQTGNPVKVQPMLPIGIYVLFGLLALNLAISLITAIKLPKPQATDRYEMEPKYQLFLMILPFVILTLVFAYLPLWGWRYAFFNYKPGLGLNEFVGLKWFTFLFENPATRRDIARVITNTLAMSGIGIATSWLPMAFAIFLAEIKSARVSRMVQTFTTIPNFISWVLVYTFAFALFSTEGFVNSMLIDLGIIEKGRNFLMDGDHIWLKMWAWNTWKGLGWSAIIYIAGISGIDQQLYEAATIDGAGRFRKMWNITVPGLIPTFSVLLLLSIAGILSNGMDQYFVFKNSANKTTIEVLDLYVYTLGLGSGGSGNIPLATVVGMLKSIISVTLLFTANRISKLVRGETIV